ncbi:2-phospho-L-lactate transferase [Sanguibacter sp. 25GB23B1]|uniref:2-phospho-L-lactate transferase n=1 Tax=unclassified Sanguibacter TaxID=2645534 RepID=UPI0032AE8E55
MKITLLAGGVGGARFTRGLLHLLANRYPDGVGGTTAEVTVVANTGDDMWLHGVRVCPDLDTVMYTLGGAIHEGQGWGRQDESSRVSHDLAAYDLGWDWFTLGDLDLATHLARTQLLQEGKTLTEATAHLCRRWEPGVTLLPMSDQPVETHVVVGSGTQDDPERRIHFEEWWVRHRAGLPARRFEQVGLDSASATPQVLEAISTADLVLLPPSNPVVSVGTILTVPGIREALRAGPAPVVGVSPIIGGAALRGMADACLTAIGVETNAAAVALWYGATGSAGGILDGWLVDDVDADAVPGLEAAGIRTRAVPLLMTDVAATAQMAAAALDLVGVG